MISPTTGKHVALLAALEHPLAPAERGAEFNQKELAKGWVAQGDPNRFTVYPDPKAPPGDPMASPVHQTVTDREYVCAVCETVCVGMQEFNEHCRIIKGRLMQCELDKRVKEKTREEGTDPSAVAAAAAKATTEALAPTLNAIAQALTALAGAVTSQKPPAKPKEAKPRGRARRIQGTPRKGGSAPESGMGQPPLAVDDPPEEPGSPSASA